MAEFQNQDELAAAIEAILFVYGEPVKLKRLAEVLGVDITAVQETIGRLSEDMASKRRGINISVLDDKVALLTKPHLHETIKEIVKEELDSELTPASLETLSIVSYLGPVSRAEIDYIRGVNSSFILRNLMVRGLIQREPDKGRAGSFLYNVTFDFLKHVGVGSPSELPEFQKYKDLMKSFTTGDSKESQVN